MKVAVADRRATRRHQLYRLRAVFASGSLLFPELQAESQNLSEKGIFFANGFPSPHGHNG